MGPRKSDGEEPRLGRGGPRAGAGRPKKPGRKAKKPMPRRVYLPHDKIQAAYISGRGGSKHDVARAISTTPDRAYALVTKGMHLQFVTKTPFQRAGLLVCSKKTYRYIEDRAVRADLDPEHVFGAIVEAACSAELVASVIADLEAMDGSA